jgi:deoxyribodipyrimidine photolyase-related protein
MLKDIYVLFSIDLYKDIKKYKNKKVFLVEDELYFNRINKKLGSLRFNVLKPIYHRATMKCYYDKLKRSKIDITYVELNKDWVKIVKKYVKNNNLIFYDPVDRYMEDKIDSNFKDYEIIDTPRFILSQDDMEEYTGVLKQTSFYIWMRKKHNILMVKNKPYGNKMTYDTENRKAPYKNMEDDLPEEVIFSNKYIKEAISYVKKTFNDKSLYVWDGKLKDINDDNIEIKFPINHKDTEERLKDFIKNYLKSFGDYQDAIINTTENSLIFHSGLSPMLNVGLITPKEIIDEVLKVFNKSSSTYKKNNINNVEGFIRQILGWREFCRYTYEHHSDKYLNKNHFNNNKKLTKMWYNSTTNIEPVDMCIEKAFKYGYLHHIERLMIMANIMNISNIHPKEMYKWFMEFALDSYDWVMEYNIYSMGTYSDGGNFTTKPYISSSNYVLKMSNFKKTESNWTEKWNILFWKFMKKNKAKIKKIPRLSMLLKHISKHI